VIIITKAFDYILYEKSAHLGHNTAMYNLGTCYEGGRGVTKDLNQARDWYTKAAAQGYYANAQPQLDRLIARRQRTN